MRKTMFRLALLGAVAAVPAYAQVSPATPDRTTPNAAAQDSTTRPGMTTPAPDTRSGATAPGRDATSGATTGATTMPGRDTTTGATTPTRDTDSGNAAVRTDDGTRTATTPAPGANSFTEGQAKSRIEAAGFTNVSDLQKDDQGIWRGRAQRGGQQVSVALDFQGNVVPGPAR